MKRWLSRLAILALAAYVVFTVVCAISPLGYGSGGKWFTSPCDFSLRMTELACLKTGTNPFDVWHGDIVKPPFRPNYNSKVSGPEFTEDLNAYAPWEYTLMLPLSYLPRSVAWGMYFWAMIGMLLFLAYVGYRLGKARFGNVTDAILVGTLPVLLIAYPAWSNACIGNFSIIVLAATVAMAVALNRGMDSLAGLFWAIAMLKPQIAVLLAVPLLLRRKFLTCTVAASICFFASLLPAWMCGVSPVRLILQTPAANAFMFQGCGTWPYVLCGTIGETGDILAALAVGILGCVLVTKALPKNCDWMMFLAPAAVFSMSWTYASTYGHVMAWFFFLFLTMELVKNPHSRMLGYLAVLSLFVTTRVYNCYRGAVNAFSGLCPELGYSKALHHHLDSLNSLLDILLFVVFVYFFLRENSKGRKCSRMFCE